MTFRAALRKWRTKHRLSQKEAAGALGVGYEAYKNWECRTTEPPSTPCRKCVEERMNQYAS